MPSEIPVREGIIRESPLTDNGNEITACPLAPYNMVPRRRPEGVRDGETAGTWTPEALVRSAAATNAMTGPIHHASDSDGKSVTKARPAPAKTPHNAQNLKLNPALTIFLVSVTEKL